MEEKYPQLYMCLVGCKPMGRHIEQHDIFFTIASERHELEKQLCAFWPDGGRLHLDGWRKVSRVGTVAVKAVKRVGDVTFTTTAQALFFINLGGYQPGQFEELHHKLLTVQSSKAAATSAAKQSAFYRSSKGSHIDDQYGVDIDDIYNVEDILPFEVRRSYRLVFERLEDDHAGLLPEDPLHIGYTKFSQLGRLFE